MCYFNKLNGYTIISFNKILQAHFFVLTKLGNWHTFIVLVVELAAVTNIVMHCDAQLHVSAGIHVCDRA